MSKYLNMKTLKFSNGDEMPILGLGTFKSEPGNVKEIVSKAIAIGYRHFDCAAVYGNEKEIGEALAEAMDSGIVERKALWITSKLWNNCHKQDDVMPALEKSLKHLKLDYLDLYLIHWPVAQKKKTSFPASQDDFLDWEKAPLEETWEGMEDCLDDKLTKHIGVSNFNIAALEIIRESAWSPPELNQVELHPFLPQITLYDYCRSNDILMTAYGPLGAPYRQLEAHGKMAPYLMGNNTVKDIAAKHKCTVAQALIAWSIARKVAVIPKTVKENRLQENFEAADVKLDREDLRNLALLPKHRYVDGLPFTILGSPYKLKDLWEY
ncbi:MAG: alcohol dehydrogenase (NADP+) [Cyclobacteriaceae bacterium]